MIEGSLDLTEWEEVSSALIAVEPPQPTGDGITVHVTRLLLIASNHSHRYLRLRVGLAGAP